MISHLVANTMEIAMSVARGEETRTQSPSRLGGWDGELWQQS